MITWNNRGNGCFDFVHKGIYVFIASNDDGTWVLNCESVGLYETFIAVNPKEAKKKAEELVKEHLQYMVSGL